MKGILFISMLLAYAIGLGTGYFVSLKVDKPCVQEYNGPIDWEKVPDKLKMRSSISPYLPFE